MKKISIPELCSENWNEMTPTEKGAFCQKCSFEVIDFTKKTPEEIRETITQNLGHRLCGHVSKMQLDLVNTNFHVWDNQPVHIFQSKFLYACVLVFGMTLFTGCGSDELTENKTPEIENIDVGMMIENDTLKCGGDEVLIIDTTSTKSNHDKLMGKPMISNDDYLIDGMMETDD